MKDPKWIFVAGIVSLLISPFIYIIFEGRLAVISGFFFMLLGIFLFWQATKATRSTAEK